MSKEKGSSEVMEALKSRPQIAGSNIRAINESFN